MTLIREIRDRAACAAWSPISTKSDWVVLGTKDSGGAGFEDTGGELEIYDWQLDKANISNTSSSSNATTDATCQARIKTQARFASVAWTSYTGREAQTYPLGLIAGGMMDGTLHLWDPTVLIAEFKKLNNKEGGEETAGLYLESTVGLVTSLSTNTNGPIKALAFNPLEPFHLAVGGSTGTSWMLNLSRPQWKLQEPAPGHAQKAEITAIAWNSQVAHIVATAAADGSVSVWDLNAQKAWCELRAESGQAVSDLAWNPQQGLHLLTASADDRNPMVKMWDLAASTSMPVQQLSGHQGGILQLSWCPHDDSLLLTTAKDTRTFLWDLATLQPIAELPNDDAAAQEASSTAAAAAQTNPSALFAQASSFGQKHMRYQVAWSPHKRGLALTCSLDRKVQAHSILSLATKSGRPPAWMKPASTVLHMSFGGTLLTCQKGSQTVKMETVAEQPAFVKRAQKLEHELNTLSIGDFCRLQQEQQQLVKNVQEANIWGFMRMLFQQDARQALLEHLGFRKDQDLSLHSDHSSSSHSEGVSGISNGLNDAAISSKPMSTNAQAIVQKALVMGNFETAVDTCFQMGNLADALLLASCGGADLWAKTQQRYFESSSRPYLSIVKAVIRNQMEELIQERDTALWQETLAILSTYGASGEFPKLCILLGQRLDAAGDAASASLCYMCALSLEDTVKFWKAQLDAASSSGQTKSDSMDLKALHQFTIKVHVFLKAIATSETSKGELSSETSSLFFQYAKSLAEDGAFASAAKYCEGSSEEAKILRDRLYRGRSSQACLAAMGGAPPEFPYTMVNVQTSRGQVYAQQQRDAIAYQKQQEEYRRQQQEQQEQQRQQAMQQQQQQQQQRAQQQVYNNQQGHIQQQQTPMPDALPPGWMALQDPTSGRTYYANQTTGESAWEKPMPAAPVPAPAPAMQPSVDQPMANSSTHSTSTPKKQTLASRYGDGFVSSASDPKLANQYGNVGTNNPYGGVDRPGTAASVLDQSSTEQPPISATPNLDDVTVPEDVAVIRDSFLSVVQTLKDEGALSVSEKRQVSEAEKGVTILVKKLARGAISEELKAKISSLAMYLVNRDFATASTIQTGLVNSDWKTQKDWLKGVKLLIQISSKKLQPAHQPGY